MRRLMVRHAISCTRAGWPARPVSMSWPDEPGETEAGDARGSGSVQRQGGVRGRWTMNQWTVGGRRRLVDRRRLGRAGSLARSAAAHRRDRADHGKTRDAGEPAAPAPRARPARRGRHSVPTPSWWARASALARRARVREFSDDQLVDFVLGLGTDQGLKDAIANRTRIAPPLSRPEVRAARSRRRVLRAPYERVATIS